MTTSKKLDKKNTVDMYPLTSTQEGILFHYLKDPTGDIYFEQLCLEIEGVINKMHFQEAWDFVIQSNEVLRTVFRWEKVESPIQIVLKEHKPVIKYFNYTGIERNEAEKQKQLEEVKTRDRAENFDLREVPFRITLCKFGNNNYEMIISNHHILYDGWSTGVILREFFENYHNLSKGLGVVVIKKTKFKEYVKGVHKLDWSEDRVFWNNYLSGFEKSTEIFKKNTNKKNQINNNACSHSLTISEPAKSQLDEHLKKYNITWAVFIYSVWGLLLSKYSNSDDILFGTTVSGRSAKIKEIENIVGLFINTIPLRLMIPGDIKVSEFLYQVTQELTHREKFEGTPLVKIKEFSQLNLREELFDTIIIIENYPLDKKLKNTIEDEFLFVKSHNIYERTHYDLCINAQITSEIGINLLYNQLAFETNTIKQISSHLLNLILWLISEENLDKPIEGIVILTEEEKRRLVFDFNDTSVQLSIEKNIIQIFSKQAKIFPDRNAIFGPGSNSHSQNYNDFGQEIGKSPGEENIHISYQELITKSIVISQHLLNMGVRPNDVIAVILDRSMEMVSAIYAILLAGAAYLPIDPGLPCERIDYMLLDSGTMFLITTTHLRENNRIIRNSKRNSNLKIIYIDDIQSSSLPSQSLTFSLSHFFSLSHSANLAYVIYTSGSTGRPKGVLVNHLSMLNILLALQDIYPVGESDGFLFKTQYCFDVSITELFGWFFQGGKLIILMRGGEKEPTTIIDWIEKYFVTHINFVPSMFGAFLKHLNSKNINRLSPLKYILLAGEVIPPYLVNQFKQLKTKVKLENIYGPTENTIYTTGYSLSDWSGEERIPIGKPLPNIMVFILDRFFNIQPLEVCGELYIGGKGLAQGYLNHPELTAEKFYMIQPGALFRKTAPGPRKNFLYKQKFLEVQKPFSKKVSGHRRYKGNRILYRTGDLARWLSDGNIDFLGRIDHQVKVRGYRIELQEIESHLLQNEKIKDVVVKTVKESGQDNLVAYIVTRESINVKELREYLAQRLPEYMIPSHYFEVEEIPLTISGKINRNALHNLGQSLKQGSTFVPPQGSLEKDIAGIWKELLGKEQVGVDDNFFDLGGNSLLILRLNSRLKKLVNREIDVLTIFNNPTIRQLAQYFGHTSEMGLNNNEIQEGVSDFPIKSNKDNTRAIDIAVIGMACRFPGARNISEFWENLKNGVESITFFSDAELECTEWGNDKLSCSNYIPVKGVLEENFCFDFSFFDYIPSEAEIMDPQVRIFHECTWEALENAGYSSDINNVKIGLYAGASPNPLWEILPFHKLKDNHMQSYSQLWDALQYSDKDYLCARIGYKLDLKGPCVTLQTACSTSLAAVDQACRGLVSNSCKIALAGGVSITLHDDNGYLYQEGTIMSADGHCRAFDFRSNGTVSGNGAGVVVLKRLKEAIKDGDTVYAIIKGIGINNDGKNKVGFTAPSSEGQAMAISESLKMAGINSEDIGYIETHGTGTSLGDPIEIEGLKLAFNTRKRNYCAIGSVKSNIGHLDAAAGIAGLIKTVLILKHRIIPPTLHFEKNNPTINYDNNPFYVNTQLKSWPFEENLFHAGVSSFGLGGTNVHVILEEYHYKKNTYLQQQTEISTATQIISPYLLFPFSAKTESALQKISTNVLNYFKKNPGINLADAAYTLQVGRKFFPYRKKIVVDSRNNFIQQLEEGEMETSLSSREKKTIVFMFSGQGNQYINMGKDLYENYSIFQQQMDQGFEIMEKTTGIKMKSILFPDGSEIEEASKKIGQFIYTTPIKFLFEYSLAVLLMSWGIRPDAMIGHSFGEYVAACLSGVYSFEEGLFLAALRGELMHQLPPGAMIAVPLAEDELKPILEDNDQLSLAAVNSQSMCVVSGPIDKINLFEQELNEKGYQCIRYHVPKAGHSWMVTPILNEFKKRISKVGFNEPQIPYISGITGNWITSNETTDPGYWMRHLQETVRFSAGLDTLAKMERPIFIQVGPGRGLTLFVKQHTGEKFTFSTFDLIKHRKEKTTDTCFILEKIGQLWLQGIEIDWQKFNSDQVLHRIPLPSYPFEGQYFFPPQNLFNFEKNSSSVRPLLNSKSDLTDWFYIPVWEQYPTLSSSIPQLLENHAPFNCMIFLDNLGLGEKLVQELRDITRELVVIKKGDDFVIEDSHSYIINPGKSSHYEQLFQKIYELKIFPDRIVHLWSITKYNDVQGLKNLDYIQELGFYSLFYIAQTLGRKNISREMHINVVSNNMHNVSGEEDTCPGKATIRGAVKIIPLEYNNLKCTSIDIFLSSNLSQIPDQLIQNVLKEILAEPNVFENIIALRGNCRWYEVMKPFPLKKKDPVYKRIKERGVYLITGGFGGMGFTLAQHLAEEFKARIILVSRSYFPRRKEWSQWLVDHPADDQIGLKIKKIIELEELGAEFLICSADVSDDIQMQEVISQAHQQFGKINGVLHTAGVGDYAGLIQDRTREMTEQVMAPKVRGTLVLEKVLKEDCLDFLVLFSSIGNNIYQVKFAQVGYNAANEFLETYANHSTKKNGIYTVTINWNDWLEVGMSIEATNRKYLKHWKYKLYGDQRDIDYESAIHGGIKPVEGIEVFERIMNCDLERVTVSRVDLNEIILTLRGLVCRETYTFDAIETQVSSIAKGKRPILTTVYNAPTDSLEKNLCKIWSDYFGIESIGTADDFFELGGDSLKAMIIIQKIQKQLDIRVPLNTFFKNPTIQGVSDYIHRASKNTFFSITPVEKKEYYSLSSAQKRIYTLQQMESNFIAYNIPCVFPFPGLLDKEKVALVFKKLVHRHESLRTSFIKVNEFPVQRINTNVELNIEYNETSESEIREIFDKYNRVFNLEQSPLLRVCIIILPNKEHLVLLVLHHIISDGSSLAIILNDFDSLYLGEKLPGLKLQYKDFSEWQNHLLTAREIKEQEDYWMTLFKGKIPCLELPIDFERPGIFTFEGSRFVWILNKELGKEFKLLGSQYNGSLFMNILTLINIFFYLYSGQTDIIIGTGTAGRTHDDFQDTIGMFVNTLAIRNYPQGEKSYLELLKEVIQNILTAFENQDLQFEELIDKLDLSRDSSRNPLFDVFVISQNFINTDKKKLSQIHQQFHKMIPHASQSKYINNDQLTSKFDLSFYIIESDDNLYIEIEYYTAIFRKETIEKMVQILERIMQAVIKNPKIKLSDIQVPHEINMLETVDIETQKDFGF